MLKRMRKRKEKKESETKSCSARFVFSVPLFFSVAEMCVCFENLATRTHLNYLPCCGSLFAWFSAYTHNCVLIFRFRSMVCLILRLNTLQNAFEWKFHYLCALPNCKKMKWKLPASAATTQQRSNMKRKSLQPLEFFGFISIISSFGSGSEWKFGKCIMLVHGLYIFT